MTCLGKIRNSLTIVVYLRILGISWLTNPTSPIREFFRALVVDGTQSSDSEQKNITYILEAWIGAMVYYEMVNIRLTGCGMTQI